MEDHSYRINRRSLLKSTGAAGTAGLVGLAGCSGGGNGQNGNGTTSASDKQGNKGTSGGNFEIIHWWTAGGEKQAISALIEGFKKKHPDVEINNNPAPGGAGSALDAVIKNRVLNKNPPSTFQIWPGKALHPYVEGDVLNDISDSVYTKTVKDAYVQGVLDAAKPQGNFVAVPINIHRLNNLFYNNDVVKEADVDPSSISDAKGLLDAMKTIQQKTGKTPMAHQTKTAWSTVQLWENVFIAQNSVSPYTDLTNKGNVSAHEQQVKEALSLVKEYHNFFPKDAGSLTWDQANSRVIKGDAAFIHQGDWAAGQYLSSDNFNYQKQWNQLPFPGTKGVYQLVMDSFVFPKNNPTPELTKKWLQYCASVDAQKRFNPPKGSIPPRTDVPTDPFGPFLTDQIDDFKNSKQQPPCIAHGTAVVPEVKSNIESAFSGFLESWNVNETYGKLKEAFQTS